MAQYTDRIRNALSGGPRSARQLLEKLEISQPTLSRALAAQTTEVVRIGAGPSIQYALRDGARGLPDIPVYRVDVAGQIARLGILVPVRPEGFVMQEDARAAVYCEGLPWWLFDMLPQGYLGRAYCARYASGLGLPDRLSDWSDTHALKALLTHGHDVVGNLLLGDVARSRFLEASHCSPIAADQKPEVYARLAREAARGEIPGSSAGGEQPKFTAYAMTPEGARHVLVKFSEAEEGPVSERWRDLLLAEHLALETLRAAGIPSSTTRVIDSGAQRFLEVDRFDRIGALGRRALFSLTALDAAFVGAASEPWPVIATRLAEGRHIRKEAASTTALLWAFGILIGNSDMHGGNLSFVTEDGRPYDIAPAYDMSPMALAPRSGGGTPDTLAPANIHACVSNQIWRDADELARTFIDRLNAEKRFSKRFETARFALTAHVEEAGIRIGRLG